MAISTKMVKLAIGEEKVLHRSVATRFSVEILEGRGLVRMQRVRFGLVGDAFADSNFEFLTRVDTIPVGSVRAIPAAAQAVQITYKVRSGRHFTGVPELAG